jgi:hypothetical protein
MVPARRIDDQAVNDLLERVVPSSPTTPHSIAASWRNGSLPSPRNIGHAVVPTLTGKPRESVHRLLNSFPIPSGSSTTAIEPPAIVERPCMLWHNPSPVRAGSHYGLSWTRRDCRPGAYGRETPPSKRRMSSRPEVTPGAPESSGDQNAGITRVGRR